MSSKLVSLVLALTLVMDPIAGRAAPWPHSETRTPAIRSIFFEQALMSRLTQFFQSSRLNRAMTAEIARQTLASRRAVPNHIRILLWGWQGGVTRQGLAWAMVFLAVPVIEHWRAFAGSNSHENVRIRGIKTAVSLDSLPQPRQRAFDVISAILFGPVEWARTFGYAIGIPLLAVLSPLILAHMLYQPIALALGLPLAVGELPDELDMASGFSPVLIDQPIRNEPGFGRVHRDFSPAERRLRDRLVERSLEDGWPDRARAVTAVDTLLSLRFDSLKQLERDKFLTVEEINALNLLEDSDPSEAIVDSMARKLARELTIYEEQVREQAGRPAGFDEAMMSQMLSTHLLPWRNLERLQRTYGLKHDFGLIRQALNENEPERFIRHERIRETGIRPRMLNREKYFYEPGRTDTVALIGAERRRRASALIAEFENRLTVLDWMARRSNDQTSYIGLQEVTRGKLYRVQIPGDSPLQLRPGDEVFVGDFEFKFVIQSIQGRTLNLLEISGSANVSEKLLTAPTGRLRPGRSTDVVNLERDHLRQMRDSLHRTLVSRATTGKMVLDRVLGLDEESLFSDKPWSPDINFLNKDIPYVDLGQDEARGDESQEAAVKLALGPLRTVFIDGPAATGKTQVIEEIVRQAVRQGKRVLVVSQMHQAVDNVLERIMRDDEVPVLRVGNHPGSFQYGTDQVWPGRGRPETLQNGVLDNFVKKRKGLRDRYGKDGYVVGATNMGIATDGFCQAVRDKRLKVDIDMDQFDLVIMDEAGRETLSGAMIPLQYAADKVAFVGDTKQLSPYGMNVQDRSAFAKSYQEAKGIRSEAVRTAALDLADTYGSSALGWMTEGPRALFGRHGYRPYILGGRVRLSTNYRQHPLLARLAARISYNNDVYPKDWEDFDPDTLRVINLAPLAKTPAETFEKIDPDDPSSYNPTAIDQIVNLVLEFRRNYPDVSMDEIAIVTPYTKQLLLIHARLKQLFPEGPLPLVTTIDSFQGGERRFEILDMTRSNPLHYLGLLRDAGHFNVGLTRGKRKIAIVCDERMFEDLPGKPHNSPLDRDAHKRGRDMVEFYNDEVLSYYPPVQAKPDAPEMRPAKLTDLVRLQPDALLEAFKDYVFKPLSIASEGNAITLAAAVRSLPAHKTELHWPMNEFWDEMIALAEVNGWDTAKMSQGLANGAAWTAGQRRDRLKFVQDWMAAWVEVENHMNAAVQRSALLEQDSFPALTALYQGIPVTSFRERLIAWPVGHAEFLISRSGQDAEVLMIHFNEVLHGLDLLGEVVTLRPNLDSRIRSAFSAGFVRAALTAYRMGHVEALANVCYDKDSPNSLRAAANKAFETWAAELMTQNKDRIETLPAAAERVAAAVRVMAPPEGHAAVIAPDREGYWNAQAATALRSAFERWAAGYGEEAGRDLPQLVASRRQIMEGPTHLQGPSAVWLNDEDFILRLQAAIGDRLRAEGVAAFQTWGNGLVSRVIAAPAQSVDGLRKKREDIERGYPGVTFTALDGLIVRRTREQLICEWLGQLDRAILSRTASSAAERTSERRAGPKDRGGRVRPVAKRVEASPDQIAALNTVLEHNRVHFITNLTPELVQQVFEFLGTTLLSEQRVLRLGEILTFTNPADNAANAELLRQLALAREFPDHEALLARWNAEFHAILRGPVFSHEMQPSALHARIEKALNQISKGDQAVVVVIVADPRYLRYLPDSFFTSDRVRRVLFLTMDKPALEDEFNRRRRALDLDNLINNPLSLLQVQAARRMLDPSAIRKVNLTFWSEAFICRMVSAIDKSKNLDEAKHLIRNELRRGPSLGAKTIGLTRDDFSDALTESGADMVMDVGTMPDMLINAHWVMERLLIKHLQEIDAEPARAESAFADPQQSLLLGSRESYFSEIRLENAPPGLTHALQPQYKRSEFAKVMAPVASAVVRALLNSMAALGKSFVTLYQCTSYPQTWPFGKEKPEHFGADPWWNLWAVTIRTPTDEFINHPDMIVTDNEKTLPSPRFGDRLINWMVAIKGPPRDPGRTTPAIPPNRSPDAAA